VHDHGLHPDVSARVVAHVSRIEKAKSMQVPSILQRESRTRLLQGIAIGAIATMVIGFYWGGWVTGGTAKSLASEATTNGRMSVLVPLCVAQFMAIDGAVTKIKATAPYNHDNVVRDFVKTVAGTEMDYSFARLCAAAVDDTLAKTAAKG
jgi:hypothetical protein